MANVTEIMQMCRLCLVKEEVNIPIFSEPEDVHEVLMKITACLPVKISREDNLPKKVCDGCGYKLDLLYQFWNTATSAEKQLIDWLESAGVDPKHNGTTESEVYKTVQPLVLKQEPNADESLSADTQSYILQQQQLPVYQQKEEYVPKKTAQATRSKSASTTQVSEPPAKRPRRATRSKPALKDSSDEDDLPLKPGNPKTEDESDDGDMPDADVDADADFGTGDDEENDTDQPGPSGVGKTDAPPQKRRRGRPKGTKSSSPKTPKIKVRKERPKQYDHTYNCPHCTSTFTKAFDFVVHKKEHAIDNLYDCIYCDFKTSEIADINSHLNLKHDKAPKFTCSLCKKGFNVYSWYVEHANYHTGERPFVCELCGKAFLYSRYLSAHKTSMHFEDEHGFPKLHECLICNKQYQHRNSLKVHMNSHTGNVAICDICGKQLSSKEKLKLHIRIHTGHKPFKCDFCEKAFTKKTILVEHVRTHTGEKPYQCDYCEKRFSQRTSVVIHMRSHTGERPYVCHICSKGFVARAMLNIHFKSCRGFE